MSNCIVVHNPNLIFAPGVLDGEALVAALAEHREHVNRSYCQSGPTDINGLICQAAQWFLIPDQNLFHREDGSWTVALGLGHSVHTNRDLVQTLSVLAKYLSRPLTLLLSLSDEYDGFKAKFTRTYSLEPGQPVKQQGI